MTTKEISQQIVSSLIAEIPIEYRDGRDQMEIEEEMDAIVFDGVERLRQQMVEKVCKWFEEQFYYSNLMEGCKKIPELEREFEVMLNENKIVI